MLLLAVDATVGPLGGCHRTAFWGEVTVSDLTDIVAVLDATGDVINKRLPTNVSCLL